MRCPKDDTDLIEIERQGIDIDYCPTCKGVWLDRSELDQLIARSPAQVTYEEASPRDQPEPRRKSGGLMDRVGGMFDDDRDSDRSRQRGARYDDRDDDDDDRGRSYRDRDDDRYSRDKKKKGRKRGMLEDLFDF
jgi:Zn-finger nucleic acid-binding protein